MDLSEFSTKERSNSGALLSLEAPDGTDLYADDEQTQRMGIRLLGVDSKKHERLAHDQRTKALAMAQKLGKRYKIESEKIEEDSMQQLVACTVELVNIKLDGVMAETSSESVRALYLRFPWIREQVDAFIFDRSNFLGE